LAEAEVSKLTTDLPCRLRVSGDTEEKETAPTVIAHLPGRSSRGDTKLDHELILVLAPYDGYGRDTDGTLYPGANSPISGVATMLEIARSWEESGYQPRRTFLFVNYIAEGSEYGKDPSQPMEIERFLVRWGFATAFQIKAIVHVGALAGAEGDQLLVSAGGSMRLANLLERAAGLTGTDSRRVDDPVDLSKMFRTGNPTYHMQREGQDAPTLAIEWEGVEVTERLPTDRWESLSLENLEQAGKTISLALMGLGGLDSY
jgi:hypothetical protein